MGHVIHVAVVAASLGCVSTLLLVFMWRWCHHKKEHRDFVEANSLSRVESLQAGIARLHHQQQPAIYHNFDHKNKGNNFYVFQDGVSRRGNLFNWDDHPYLVVDAVENGWSRFAFTNYKTNMAAPSKRSALLGACAAGEYGRENETEISWEVCNGSVEYMQKIRLNPGLKEVLHTNNNSSNMSVASVIGLLYLCLALLWGTMLFHKKHILKLPSCVLMLVIMNQLLEREKGRRQNSSWMIVQMEQVIWTRLKK